MSDDQAEPLALRSPEQFKALGHPVRHRIVNVLRQRPATLRQLSTALGLAKGTVGYHVRVLCEADLIHLKQTRQVRGGTEQYFALVSHDFTFHEDAHNGPQFLINAALGEMLPARPGQAEHTALRHLWLSQEQAHALAARLGEQEAEPHAADGTHREPYGLLVSLFPADIPTLEDDTIAPGEGA
ncbi:winged helix-turn-helix transcriptional regulator [Streptomyces sp. HNM0575]|uniref:ArsR/SmtB family transcription factor n=1 Tax=Streptomyces sp. HNM0575 TaxID=2716338 RepID=UPI00145E4201|nr:winged helix-turn-helix domain-containing protein [Streptomyces sp. HNM0575]NLU75935.1 winged helix-turn-helix transcriptional regulator [Streptomyces sp. HNM0575]